MWRKAIKHVMKAVQPHKKKIKKKKNLKASLAEKDFLEKDFLLFWK